MNYLEKLGLIHLVSLQQALITIWGSLETQEITWMATSDSVQTLNMEYSQDLGQTATYH